MDLSTCDLCTLFLSLSLKVELRPVDPLVLMLSSAESSVGGDGEEVVPRGGSWSLRFKRRALRRSRSALCSVVDYIECVDMKCNREFSMLFYR